MSKNTLEEKIYLAWYEDGLLDIFVGALLLIVGIQFAYPADYLMPVGIMAAFFWFKWSKSRITDKRLGSVTFSKERQKAIDKLRNVLITFMVSAMVVGVIIYQLGGMAVAPDGTPGWPAGMPIGLILLVGMGIIAQMVPLKRFSLYSILFAGMMAVDILLAMPLFYAFVVSGFVMVFTGSGDLNSFKNKYPVREMGDE